ncbi:hypothetical protein BJX70DRAFT_401714 [Aspergillus crustosus]
MPGKVRLGDAVFSAPSGQYPGVVQWDIGKAESEGFRRTGALNNPPDILLTAVSKLESRHLMDGLRSRDILDTVEKMAHRFTRCDALDDLLADDDHRREEMSEKMSVLRTLWAAIVAFVGFYLSRQTYMQPSGNQVIKDAQLRDSICASLDDEVLCVEMEAAGLMINFHVRSFEESVTTLMKVAALTKELLAEVQARELDTEQPVRDILNKSSCLFIFKDYESKTLAVNVSVLERKNDIHHVKSLLDDQRASQLLNWLAPANYGPQQRDLPRK